MSCDVYVLPDAPCDIVWAYPSQVHPHDQPCVGCGTVPEPPRRRYQEPVHPFDVLLADDDMEVALALLELL